jgi:WD40 repeat protein
VIAFQSLCMEPNEELRHYPVSSSSYIRALISVGTHVWCGHASGEIEIWDGVDGEHLNTISAHPGVGVSALFYSERSGQVWSGGGDGKLCVWGTTGKPYGRRMGQSHVSAVRIIAQIGSHIWTISDSVSGAFLWESDHYHANEHSTMPNGSSPFAANGKSSRPSRISPVPFSARSPTPPRKIKDQHKDAEEAPASVVHLGPGVVCLLAVPHLEGTNTTMWVGTTEGSIRVIDSETKEVYTLVM